MKQKIYELLKIKMKKVVMEGDNLKDYLIASSPPNEHKFILKVNETLQPKLKPVNQ
jgi:hypothetical protein